MLDAICDGLDVSMPEILGAIEGLVFTTLEDLIPQESDDNAQGEFLLT